MRSRLVKLSAAACAALLVAALSACASQPAKSTAPASGATTPAAAASASPSASASAPAAAVAAEKPVAPETNPPGDIPDSQAFVAFSPAPWLRVKIPEGWSRRQGANSVEFTDKLNTIGVAWAPAAGGVTVAAIKSGDVAKLAAITPAFQLESVTAAKLPAGAAVLTTYRANSAPNRVTGKKYRLDVQRYTLVHQGKRVDLTLSSPAGADNVDPWRIVSQSLAWHL